MSYYDSYCGNASPKPGERRGDADHLCFDTVSLTVSLNSNQTKAILSNDRDLLYSLRTIVWNVVFM